MNLIQRNLPSLFALVAMVVFSMVVFDSLPLQVPSDYNLNGEVTGTLKIRRKQPVEAYLQRQKRYAHLFGKKPAVETIARLQAAADKNIRKYGLLDQEAN